MKKLFLALLVISATTQACKMKQNQKSSEQSKALATEKAEAMASNDTQIPVAQSIMVSQSYRWPGKTDSFSILNHKIVGDSLKLTVQYGGGCQEHQFTMHTTGAWMKSMPPKMNLWLEHQSNEDRCRALIQQELIFILTPVQYNSSSMVQLLIHGANEEVVEIDYRYSK